MESALRPLLPPCTCTYSCCTDSVPPSRVAKAEGSVTSPVLRLIHRHYDFIKGNNHEL